jgi:group I intron endonuclease
MYYICNVKKVLYIYRITNMLNGKKYIGKHSSGNIDNGYYGSGIAVKKAIKKYGKSNFTKDVICICQSEKELNEMEIYWINKEGTFLNGYNMTKGGDGTLGRKQTKESIEKASASRREYYIKNPKARENISLFAKSRTGVKNPFYGKTLTKSHIDKMTKARVLAITGGSNPSARKIKCVELDKEFDTAKDAAIFCGLSCSTTILKCAKGQRKTAGGYTWVLL